MVYSDDVIIYLETVTERLTHILEVLKLMQTARVTMKVAKCTFSDTAVSYLDRTIRPGQLEVDKRNLVVIERATAWKNQTGL